MEEDLRNLWESINGIQKIEKSGKRWSGEDLGRYQQGKNKGDGLKEVYNSIKESPNYPEGFEARKNVTTKNTVNIRKLLAKLREIETGTWRKVYKDGYDMQGNEISIHYFQSESGKVFDVQVHSGWSN